MAKTVKTPELPPAYTSNVLETDVETPTSMLANLRITETVVPSINQCIAHLRLLEAFHKLREDIGTQDGLFGLNDAVATINGVTDDTALFMIREKRWAVFVCQAVERFTVWYDKCVPTQIVPQSIASAISYAGTPMEFTESQLPPLGTKAAFQLYINDL